MKDLRAKIRELDELERQERLDVLERFLDALEDGQVRAARPDPDAPGGWAARSWVKEGVLSAFAVREDVDFEVGPFRFRDRRLLPPVRDLDEGVRVVPGGSAVRRGACLEEGVVVMPPAYVNVGAHVGGGTLIDSHALVGSCAQVGPGVHLSAAAQIGGVLEPVRALPVVVEEDVFVGGGAGLYEGVVVRKGAVLAAGVVLTASTRLYDLDEERVLRAVPEEGRPLVVPPRSVVVPGTRRLAGDFARQHGLGLSAPVIVKRRDEGTDAATALEEVLRP